MKERLGSTRARLALGGVALAVVAVVALLVAQPWAPEQPRAPDETPNGPDFGDAELWIQNPDNRERAATADEIREAFPLPIQLPAYVPEGYELTMVTFFEPPPGLDRLSFANDLTVRFQRAGAGGLTLSQRPGSSIGITDVPSESLTVHETEAQYVRLDRAEGIQTLTWARCRRVFLVESTPLDALSKDDLIRIAESVGPEKCE